MCFEPLVPHELLAGSPQCYWVTRQTLTYLINLSFLKGYRERDHLIRIFE
jgi:hypothetical protein